MPAARRILFAGLLSAAALLVFLARTQFSLLFRLLTGGAVIAYLFFPLSQWFANRLHLSRAVSILCSFLTAAAAIALLIILFLPPLIGQIRDLIAAMPALISSARFHFQSVNRLLAERGFSRLSLPDVNWERILSSLPPLLGGTASLAGSVVSLLTEWTLSFMLGYYFLRDRERVLLHLELCVPASFRRLALRMAISVSHEISTFLRGQLLISAVVALLSAAGLMIAGVKSFLALGLIVGIFNIIPYFGPILGAIPAVLIALAQNPNTALFAALALFAVQQIDSMIVSPRIMGALTGLHPGTVLLAITLGSSFAGVAGMLLAIPVTLAIRAVSRVWASRHELN